MYLERIKEMETKINDFINMYNYYTEEGYNGIWEEYAKKLSDDEIMYMQALVCIGKDEIMNIEGLSKDTFDSWFLGFMEIELNYKEGSKIDRNVAVKEFMREGTEEIKKNIDRALDAIEDLQG